MRRRLDAELVRRGLAESRTQARGLIEGRRVLVGGVLATKPARQVDAGEPVLLDDGPAPYVGRGAHKLVGALDEFDLDPGGLRVLDAGASTGGFTDVLLQRGAAEVVALDVGHGQLHERLRGDPRVVVLERTNLRQVDPDRLGPFDAVVGDLSFISLRTVMHVLVGCCAVDGWLVLLVKPQFEAGRAEVARGRGVVRDPNVWAATVRSVVAAAEQRGARLRGVVPSPLRGADGNAEFLLHLRRDAPGADEAEVELSPEAEESIAAAVLLAAGGGPDGAVPPPGAAEPPTCATGPAGAVDGSAR